jgi:citrate lyase beta subunit
MRSLQFLGMQRAGVTARLARAAAGTGATVVLDLEDSLWDVTDEVRTAELRAGGRAQLEEMATDHGGIFERQLVGVRVNRLSGPEGEADYRTLGLASRSVEFECVIPTKVQSGRDLDDCRTALRRHGVRTRQVIPLVETRSGIANLAEIAATAAGSRIAWIAYGHFDYSLDAGDWPFLNHDEAAFWRWVEPIIRVVEGAGLGYVHPPYFATHDDFGFAALAGRLARTCTREFGVITVGSRQTALAARCGASGASSAVPDSTPRGATPAAATPQPLPLARHIVAAFPAGNRHHTGFALDPRTGEFISPHLYLAARRYLEGAGDA